VVEELESNGATNENTENTDAKPPDSVQSISVVFPDSEAQPLVP